MKTMFLAFCLAATNVTAETNNARKMFLGSYNNERNAKCFYSRTHAQPPGNSLETGYKGVSEIMMCEHIFNPFSKLAYFKRGKQLLETAIFAEQNNIELRYLRFTIQTNVPKILNYANNIEEDKNLLINYLQPSAGVETDEELYKMVKSYLLASEYLDDKEKSSLRLLHAEIQ